MEIFVQALWGVAAAAVSALAGVLIPAARDYATNLVQQRIGDGAARVAGEIAAKVSGDPALQAATDAMVQAGVGVLKERFPDSAGKVAGDVLAGMIKGELGKLGQAVVPTAATSLQDRLG